MDVIFQPLSTWQWNHDCINRSADYQCPNEATQEAVLGNCNIRCCEDERCKKVAAERARLLHSSPLLRSRK